jgi:hypothetical protein
MRVALKNMENEKSTLYNIVYEGVELKKMRNAQCSTWNISELQ